MEAVLKSEEMPDGGESTSFSARLEELANANFSPTVHNAAKIHKELLKRGPDGHFLGGIVHEAVRAPGGKIVVNVVHIANPYQSEPIDVVTLPTSCSKQEIEKIRNKIIPMKEAYEILVALAKAYEQRHPILIEGDTSIGKTFLVNRFMELLYGPGARPIDFYCSGQTDVSELLGKWTPKTSGLTDNERQLLDDFLRSDYGKRKVSAIQEELTEAEEMPQDARYALLQHKLSSLLEGVGFNKSVQWEFAYGAIPKAMMCNVEPGGKIVLPKSAGAGTILKIDEVGLAEPAVTMALLRVRGEAGRLTDSIQLWEAGGELVRAGSDFFIIYTTNPSDKDYVQRNEIDPALARSIIWLRKGSLCEESLSLAAQKYLSFSIGNGPAQKPLHCVIDLREEAEIASELAEVAAIVHRRYLDLMQSGEAGRRQKLPGSLDHLARLASYMLSTQVVDPNSGVVDFAETLQRGVEFVYLAGLVDPKIKETIEKELKMLLSSDTIGIKEFRSKAMPRHKILEILAEEAEARKPKIKATKNNTSAGSISQGRQMYNDFSDSLLAQLEVDTLSLEHDLLPQIITALSMFDDPEAQRELIEEITEQEKPAARTDEEWEAFQATLHGLHALHLEVAEKDAQQLAKRMELVSTWIEYINT